MASWCVKELKQAGKLLKEEELREGRNLAYNM